MTFFNKKEEVIDIQLTQYGKYLLSQGVFKPTQYAFFDSDIIYDADYTENSPGSPSEQQNDSEQRIKDSLRPKTQYTFAPGPETEITNGNINILHNRTEEFLSFVSDFNDTSIEVAKSTKLTQEEKLKLAKEMMQPAALKDYVLAHPLGTSDYSTSHAPSWKIKFLNGGLTGSSTVLSSSNGIAQIPQLYATSSFDLYTTFADADGDLIANYVSEPQSDLAIFADLSVANEMASDLAEDFDIPPELIPYDDGSVFQIKPDYFLLDVFENNTEYEKENFEIEVYKVDNEDHELLLFIEDSDEDPTITTRHVEYYFNLLVDNEIDDELFCAANHIHKKKYVFSDQDRQFDCPEIAEPIGNVYETFITDEDYEDPC